MKIKQICTVILLSLGMSPLLQAQSYDKLWKQVEQAEKKSLPKTVIQLTSDIYRKAEMEKDSPQMLKAYVWRMKYRDMLTPDSFYVSLKGLEQWAQKAEKPMDRAVLHSLTAGIYADYAQNNRWTLSQNTDLVDELPSADIREWGKNQFVEQVLKASKEALQDSLLLLDTSSRNYIPFVELGKTSEYYHHDMYHLLASRAVEAVTQLRGLGQDSLVNSRIDRIYRNMMNTYQRAEDQDALLLTTLDYLQWKRDTDASFRPYRAPKGMIGLTQDPYLAGLNKLIAENKSRDLCAEVYLAKATAAVVGGAPAQGLQICDQAIGLYPKYARINALKDLKQNILLPDLEVAASGLTYPGEELSLNVRHKNLKGFTVNLYQVNLPRAPRDEHAVGTAFLKKHARLLSATRFDVIQTADYIKRDTTLLLKTPENVGLYLLQVVPDVETNQGISRFLASTRFKVLTRGLPAGRSEAVVLDARSGHPIADATLSVFDSEGKLLQKETTDAVGKVTFPSSRDYSYLIADKGTDTAMPAVNLYAGYYRYHASQKPNTTVTLLTDRSLYRPGQTVYVKGIAYEQFVDSAHVLAGKSYTLILSDGNGQEVGKKELRTNEFGSFTTEFMLPAACLNGAFYLRTEGGNLSIRVEDYKRPTFEITFAPQKETYRLGDRVEVSGNVKTFSGVMLQGVPAHYTVTRSVRSWRFRNMNKTILASDSLPLNDEGRFTIPVTLTPDKGYQSDVNVYYEYKVEVSVTNVAGETQTSVMNLMAGERSLILDVDVPGLLCKDDSLKVTFRANNLNGQPVDVAGVYQLYSIFDYRSSVELNKQNIASAPILSGTFVSNKETRFAAWQGLPSGAYKLTASVKDDQGRTVETEKVVVFFAVQDKRPAVYMPLWYYAVNTEFDATHPARFCFGTSEKEVAVLMDVFCGERQLESKILNLSDSIVCFDFPYQEDYGNGLVVTFAFVKNGQMYERQVELTKRLPDQTLSMKWDVFRDKLRPGQKEEWKLTIRTPQGVPAVAEMLATMYDASLDKIWKTNQLLKLYYRLPVPSVSWMQGYADRNYYYYDFPRHDLKVPSLNFDHFLRFWSAMAEAMPIADVAYSGVRGTRATGALAMNKAKQSKVAYDVRFESEEISLAENTVISSSDLDEPTEEIRTNFAETAFFYPQLRTNEQGEVSFSFILPQSLTSWNFRGYSHTKQMMTGMIESSAVASKEFMLTPNLPRFVRVGDQTSVAASIANLTGKNLNGTATFTLFDPMTEKVIATQKQKFAVEAGKTVGVSFLFTATDKQEVLGCRLVADGGTFSDGEQHLLPVLSNKESLTETLALPVRGEETRTFSLADLFNHHSQTATNRRLTVEFTGNPAWYAIQALPSLSLPQNDNVVSWATTFYANTLASYIMDAQPRIKAVFDSWKLQGGTKETFLSNLQKNQEVKNILLSESPWVMEATTETEQKERIATLFDVNTIRGNNLTALTKLKELQLGSGAWSWYRGMSGSRYLTDFVVEMNARLALLTGKPLEGVAQTMQQSAFGYLNKEALNEYNALRKAEKEGIKNKGISADALKYLYLLAISEEKVPAANKAAMDYFLSKVSESLPTQSVTGKAYAAIVLNKAGRKAEAQAFMASLKEYLTQTDEQGLSFAFNESPYTWNGLRLPAHVDVMEAFEMVSDDTKVVDEMKMWLLKQKQTQQWNSPIATADAVYALLYRGANLLDNQGDVRIVLADKVMETVGAPKTSVPGLGYLKETFTDRKQVDAKEIMVEKRDAGIAWGAVYAQYEEELTQVKQQGGELNIEKKLYVEKVVNNTRQLQPVTDRTQLSVGDKVVSRLTIRLDRAMDFVQLKDQRGACFEPIGSLSGYRWDHGIGYYVAVKDASTNFFFDQLGKGVHVLEYSYRVSRAGSYETGLATIQSAYAPEYASHSASMRVVVK